MTNRIVVASQKGGVGKTTICLNLAVALAENKRRTLIVDLDPQGAIGLSLARSETEWSGLAEYLMKEADIDQAIIQTKLPDLSILPRGRLDPNDAPEFEQALYAQGVMKDLYREIGDKFDFVLLDTPPGLGMITRAAMTFADFVLIPFQAEPLALRSISQILQVVERLRSTDSPNLRLLGILPTMVELEKESSLETMKSIWTGFSGVMDTVIPRSEIFSKANREGLPLSHMGGRISPEARRFGLLAAEVENRIQLLNKDIEVKDEQPRREIL
jgi:chromosome partitioning protein